MLIKCEECGSTVSSKASVCPQCGAPIGVALGQESKPVTVQGSSKLWKFLKLISVLGLIFGFVAFLTVSGNPDQESREGLQKIYMNVITFSILGYLISRFMIWWNHG